MKAKEFDVVLLADGLTGTVVEVLGGGEAYMVERDDPWEYDDPADAIVTVKADDVVSVEWAA